MNLVPLATLAWLDRVQPEGTILTLEHDGSVAINQPHKVMFPIGHIIARSNYKTPDIKVQSSEIFGDELSFNNGDFLATTYEELWRRKFEIYGVDEDTETDLINRLKRGI